MWSAGLVTEVAQEFADVRFVLGEAGLRRQHQRFVVRRFRMSTTEDERRAVRERSRRRRANETPDQREARLAYQREYARRRRAALKQGGAS